MDDQRVQKQVDEAAAMLADEIRESYQALAHNTVSAQELDVQLARKFFDSVINNLRTQAENNLALTEDLIEQQRKQQEATQALTQELANAYIDFPGSVFAYPRQGTRVGERGTLEASPCRNRRGSSCRGGPRRAPHEHVGEDHRKVEDPGSGR